jgi:hypothetical protein
MAASGSIMQRAANFIAPAPPTQDGKVHRLRDAMHAAEATETLPQETVLERAARDGLDDLKTKIMNRENDYDEKRRELDVITSELAGLRLIFIDKVSGVRGIRAEVVRQDEPAGEAT